MNRPRILPLAVLLSIAIFTGSTRAQTTQNDETAALREKAFALLASVAGQFGALQSAENRARLGANIADSLWPHDEKLARAALFQVETDIRAELQKWQPKPAPDNVLLVFLKLRNDTVERIAKHDGEAAIGFLKATEFKHDDMPEYVFRHLDNIEMRLAQKVAANNPEAALALAREQLKKGINYELLTVLRRLNLKHKDAAQTLYKEIVSNLQTADLMNDWHARNFASNLAQSFRPPAADATIYRELISTFVAVAIKNGCGGKLEENDSRREYCYWVASEVPEMEKFDSRAARLKQWAPEAVTNFEQTTALVEMGDLLEEGTTDEILAAAAKHPEYAEPVYWHLIDRARQAGDYEQVRKIANTYIKNPEVRKNLLAQLDKVDKMKAQQVTLEQIEEQLNTFTSSEQRVTFLINVGPADRKLALKLLDRASDLTDTMKPGKEQTAAQIALAVAYCHEKSERCMGVMESLVPRLNDLVDMAAKLDGYETNYLRDGEWNMSAYGPVGELLTQLSLMAGSFAWFDFDRAVNLAGRFDRQEIRMMAHVKLAQGILAGPPKRQLSVNTGH
ncbi:MAG TPA: hypothetical protein VJT15_17550 [Pyrinomonadaceae bacterium]|nr:hypothetical protein [Pyrinomonadaceae bacterium]